MVDRVWALGPWAAAKVGDVTAAPLPEQGAIDLSATYATAGGAITWQEATATQATLPVAGSGLPTGGNVYFYCQLQSGSRQEGLLAVDWPGAISVWHNVS